jgi:predicted O-linked N-acetylglucosamine transferase (SPINDLY family)
MSDASLTLRRARSALDQGEFARSAALCRELLERDASNLQARYYLGLSCALHGEVDQAIGEWRRVLAMRPGDFATRANLGAALMDLGRADEAIVHLQAALAVDARQPQVHANLGRVLMQAGRFGDAQASFARALGLEPRNPDLMLRHAAALDQGGRLPAAIEALTRAVGVHPGNAALQHALGVCLHRAGNVPAALEHYGRALALEPASAPALRDRARALEALQRLPEALQDFQRALLGAPGDASMLAGALGCSVRLCAWTPATAYQRQLRASGSGIGAIHPFLALSTLEDPADQRRCAIAAAPPPAPAPRAAPSPAAVSAADLAEAGGKIRIAYVSSDLGDHPVGRLLCGLISHHDRSRFEVIGVALKSAPPSSATARRLRSAFDEYHDLSTLDDDAAAALLRGRGIDIALDCNGYTVGGRPGIFARRAAPVQVNYLGYAGTLGAPYIDYLIADAIVIPPGSEHWYAEQVIRLPRCYLPNDDGRELVDAPARTDAGLPQDGFVFCAFTNNYKINPPVFAAWMSLLDAVPGSVLWLRSAEPTATANLRREAQSRGVDPERLVFAPLVPDLAAHLARQRLADLFLDTSPYNAHSTTCDALWVGLPVLTCAGRSFASRVAASALTAIGLPELVTHSLPEYEQRGIELAADPERLRPLRLHLERARRSSTLFDTAGYARDLESAFATVHQRRLRGEPPAAFDVAAAPRAADA